MAIDINEFDKFKRSSQRTVALSSIAGGVVILGLLMSLAGTLYSTDKVEEKEIEISKQAIRVQELQEKTKIAAEAERHITNGIELAGRLRLSDAIEEYKQAIELNPDSANAYQFLGYTYLRRYQYSVRHDPDKVSEHPNDLIDSVNALEKAVQLDPDHIWALYNLSLAYWEQNDKSKAVETASRVLTLDNSFKDTIKNDGQFKREFKKLLGVI